MNPPAQHALRAAKFGGVRREDVSHALADLARRNLELSAALAASQANEQQLLERLRSAEDTLETFHATLEQASALLGMAEERARDIRLEAERDAGRIREEASDRVRLAEREVEELESKKRQAVASLLSLRSSLTEVLPAPPVAAPAPPAAVPPAAVPPAAVPPAAVPPAPVAAPAPPAPVPAPEPVPAPVVLPVAPPVAIVPDPEPLPEPEVAPEPPAQPFAPPPVAEQVRSLEALYLESLEANARS